MAVNDSAEVVPCILAEASLGLIRIWPPCWRICGKLYNSILGSQGQDVLANFS